MIDPVTPRSKAWRWGVCILLLAATMINYMDRQTLSATAKRVKAEFRLSNEQYGLLENRFSYAFAAGDCSSASWRTGSTSDTSTRPSWWRGRSWDSSRG